MSEFDPKMDEAFREYADLELRCHFLLLEGKDDAPEFAAAEDRMAVLWEKLDENQQRSLSGMASDLNWLRRDGAAPPKGRKTPEEVTEADRQEWDHALGAKQWHKGLHYLRLCAPMFPAVTIAHLRGSIYQQIGLANIADAFYAKASELDPECQHDCGVLLG